jgi:hypothetical protein
MSVVTADRRFTGVGEDFGPRKGTLSAHLHTTEPTDPLKTTLRDAIALHIYQDRDDTVGSYNRIICTDGVLRCMDDDHASGGINPFSLHFNPREWLYDFLPYDAVRDPNAWGVNLAAMGRKAYFDENGWPDTIIDGFARSILELEQRFGINLVVDQHADYQPTNRTDAGPICLDLVMKRYEAIKAAPEDDMPALTTYTGDWVTIDAGANVRDENGNLLFQTARRSPALRIGTVGPNSVFYVKDRNRWGYTDTAANIVAAVPLEEAFRVEVPDPRAAESFNALKLQADGLLTQLGQTVEAARQQIKAKTL